MALKRKTFIVLSDDEEPPAPGTGVPSATPPAVPSDSPSDSPSHSPSHSPAPETSVPSDLHPEFPPESASVASQPIIVISDDDEPSDLEAQKSPPRLRSPPLSAPLAEDFHPNTQYNGNIYNQQHSVHTKPYQTENAIPNQHSRNLVRNRADFEADDESPLPPAKGMSRRRIPSSDSDGDMIVDSGSDTEESREKSAKFGDYGPSPAPEPMDVDSDDEIAVLSKEEAERIGKFKKSSFETPQSVPIAPSPQPEFNQPVPVFHAGAHAAESGQTAATAAQDQSIRSYFEPFSLPELLQHETNLGRQYSGLTAARDQVLNEISDLRSQISTLGEDTPQRGVLMRLISDKLDQADDAISRSKKVRRYLSILASVKDVKMFPQKYAYSMPGSYPQIPGSFPQNAPYGQASGVFSQYPGQTGMGTSNLNPYMKIGAPSNADHEHLEQLFNDITKEEDVQGMAPTPDTLLCQLFDHQRQGLNWLLKKEQSRSGCILADDMGLGKTVQTIALIESNKPSDATCKTTIIVGPVSLLRQWAAELQKKIKREHALKVCLYIGKERKKLRTFSHLRRFDVVLISYTTLASEFKQHFSNALDEAQVTKHQNLLPDRNSGGRSYRSPFYSKDAVFFRIVLDEAQSIKNKLSLTSKSVALLTATHRLCLTGTPMQNNIEELYPILRFLRSRPYDDERKFKSDISVPLKNNNEEDRYEVSQSMKKLRAVLSAIMLRRTKNSKVDGKPLLQLPEKKIESVYVSMESEERTFYDDLEKGIQRKARKLMETSASSGNFLVLLLRLRQACIHQILVQVGEYHHAEQQRAMEWKHMYSCIEEMTREAKQNVSSILKGVKPPDSEIGKSSHSEIVDLDSDFEPSDSEIPPNFHTQEAQLTCPICFDVASENNIVLFSRCGHAICDACVDELFAQGEDDDMATCMTCKQRVIRPDLVYFSVFSKVVYEGYDYERMSKTYSSSSKKLTNGQKFAAVLGPEKQFPMSAKLKKLVEMVQKIISDTPDEKIIVFSHFVITFDLLQLLLERSGIEYLRYDGTMNIDEKNSAISEFYEGSARVLLISLKAGNVGLTLTCANHVFLMDPFWNPYVEEQAMDRAHRLGQQRPVSVYRLLIKNSVEDRITELQARKKELIGSAMDESALKSSSSLGRRELGYLFGLNSLQAE